MRALAIMALLAAVPALAQPAPKPDAPAPSPPETWLPRDTAEIQILDKVNAASTKITLKVGQAADNASLSIALRSCAIRPADLPADSAAFLDIKDSRPGLVGFHGWMFANEPALSMLEHPIYAVRLVACR